MLPFRRHIFSVSEYFICLLFLCCETLTAQNFNIQTFTTKDGLPHNDVRAVAVDSSGFLWIATWAGMNHSTLLRYDPGTEKLETILISKDSYNIEDIFQGDNEDLWLALLGDGVCNFNPGDGKKKFYTTSDGLANNITYCLLKDKTGNIWVSTNTGISRINPQTGMIRSFGPNEGLSINEFNSGAPLNYSGRHTLSKVP